MSAFDVIVIGGGHNGLTTAAALARAGRSVLVLEAADTLGGLAGAHEFHPGFAERLLHDTTAVRPAVVRQLELDKHGLRLRTTAPDVLALGAPGESLMLPGDRAAARSAIAQRAPRDAERYDGLLAFVTRTRDALGTFLDEPPVDMLDVESAGIVELLRRGLRIRKLGRRDLFEILRLPPMSAADWLDEWFELDLLKAAMALPAVTHDFTGPRSPGTNATLLFRLCQSGPGVEGGGPALVTALAHAARAHGAQIRTAARVDQIRFEGRVRGVRLTDGEEIDAKVVAAACHPAETILKLMPRRTVPFRLAHRVQRLRSRGTTALVSFALRSRPRFADRDGDAPEFVRIAASLDAIERAFDAIKYGRLSDDPALQVHVADADASSGTVLSAQAHYVPHELDGGWTDRARDQLADRVREKIETHCGNLDVVASRVSAPPDLEARFSLPQGNLHHGEHSIDQLLVRPVPECSRYATPLEGLFLCGSGSHPGGGITCAPGALAAQAIRQNT